ncbi:hypothetical protein BH10ACT11_BH10ACT11_02500 [soil metagenome]
MEQVSRVSAAAVAVALVLVLALVNGPVSVASEAAPVHENESLISSSGEVVESGTAGQGAGKAYSGSGIESAGSGAVPAPDGSTSPNGGRSYKRTVIGADDRTQVTNTTAYPSRAIGQIEFSQAGGDYICTGWLIDMDTVLTAGHCVNSGGAGGQFSTNVLFYPGRNGGSSPYGSCGTTSLLTTQAWVSSADPESDLGIIQLNCTVGYQTGWFGYRSLSADKLIHRDVAVRGYPGDEPFGTMWTMDDRIQRLSDSGNSVFYFADTFGGQSGAPVFEPSGCAGPCGLAIHAYGASGSPPANSGPRITPDRVDLFASTAASNNPVETARPDASIRPTKGGAHFAGNNVYNASAKHQQQTTKVRRGGTANFIVRVENDGDGVDLYKVHGQGHSSRFTIAYFAGSEKITDEVEAGSYQVTNLAPGQHRDIRVSIKAKGNSTPGSHATAKVTAVSDASNVSDAVKAKAQVRH